MQDLNTYQTENDRLIKEINVTNFSSKPGSKKTKSHKSTQKPNRKKETHNLSEVSRY